MICRSGNRMDFAEIITKKKRDFSRFFQTLHFSSGFDEILPQ